MTLQDFVESAWSDHADHPQHVADRLAGSFHLVQSPEDFAPFARLLTHVYGEHLGAWQEGAALLASMRTLAAYGDGAVASGPLTTGIATLRHAGGDAHATDELPTQAKVCALATAASALAARGETGPAIAAYSAALASAEASFAPDSPAVRALAFNGNNLAVTLERRSPRTATETQAMLDAAQAALKYWKQAGSWLEEERAEYRLTRSLLESGDSSAAIQSAQRCVAICKDHQAPAFEKFFSHAALSMAHRAAGQLESFEVSRRAAFSHFEALSADEKSWAASDRNELAG